MDLRFSPGSADAYRMIKNLVFLLVLILAAGCSTARARNNVRLGMGYGEVKKLLGQPDSISADSDREGWYWRAGYLDDTPSYCVVFVGGVVNSFQASGGFCP